MLDDNKNISVWQNDTVPLTSSKPDETAETATLLIGEVGEEAIFSLTAEYEGDTADLTITDEENDIAVGEYKWMVNVQYSDGASRTFPNPDQCEPDDLPDFIVKPRILTPSES